MTNPSDFIGVFEGFLPRVSAQMNDQLVKDVTSEKIKEAVFAIKPTSGPGADGKTGLFYQKYWQIIGEQVTVEVK